jgi:hypothetical protein
MIVPIALCFLALVALTSKSWLEGTGPFDEKPSGTDHDKASVNETVASSGRKYTVTAFGRGAQYYFVAVRSDASKDWISYLFDPKSKAKFLYRANGATVEAVADLRKDFAV